MKSFFAGTYFHGAAFLVQSLLCFVEINTGYYFGSVLCFVIFMLLIGFSDQLPCYPLTSVVSSLVLLLPAFFVSTGESSFNDVLLRGIVAFSVLSIGYFANRSRQQEQMHKGELLRLSDEHEKSERLFNTIAASFNEGCIAVVNSEGDLMFSRGRSVNSLLPGTGNTPGIAFAELKKLITVDNKHSLDAAFNGRNASIEGTLHQKVFQISFTPVHANKGHVQEVIVVLHDVTKYKEMELGLLGALEKERQLNLLKSGFVSSVSHQFRTPLSTILSSVFLLENYFGADKGYQDKVHYSRIKRSVNLLTELLDDFLSMDKLDQGKVKVVYSCFAFREFLSGLYDQMQTVLRNEQKLNFFFKGDDDDVILDRNLLHNILLNLISNAIKYSPPGSEVRLLASTADGHLHIEVSDQGMGIAENEQKKIFRRFFRGQNALNIQGTGLGLHLVRKYVRLMRGEITFCSAPGTGSTFRVKLPQATINNTPEPINHFSYG